MDPNNMLFRLEDLTPEKLYEEYGLSKEDIQKNPGLYKAYVDDFIPTRADLERKLDEQQLKELCLRLPCRVLMYRWNPVQDFVDQFTRQGRIQRWTKEKTQKLILKGIRRYKDECMYSEKEIRIERERQWCERKKENLMLLEVWEYDRQQEQLKENHSKQEEAELTSAVENDEHMDETLSEELTNSDSASHFTDVENAMAELHNSSIRSTPSDIVTTTDQPIPPEASSTPLDIEAMKQQTTGDVILLSPSPESDSQYTEELAGREYAEMMEQKGVTSSPTLADYMNVNTESMSLADSVSLDSGDDDDDFNFHTSMTSTQSEPIIYLSSP